MFYRIPMCPKYPLKWFHGLATRRDIPAEAWDEYGTREETRQEHGTEIRAIWA